jgi:diacylglycerol kinase family enzyme
VVLRQATALPEQSNSDALVLFNPRAGGGADGLPRLLESTTARGLDGEVVLASERLDPAVHDRVQARLPILVHGGDGTLQRTLDQLFSAPALPSGVSDPPPRIAAVGGGTMNVISRWCGFRRSPAENVQSVLHAQSAGDLTYKQVPLLRISQGDRAHVGCIFGMGPMIRVVEAFDRRRDKTKLGAVTMLARALGSVFVPSIFSELSAAVAPLDASIETDGRVLPYDQYGLLFASATDQVFLGTRPFTESRRPQTFNFAAYADSTRAISATFPLLARGWRPRGKSRRYVNQTSRRLVIRSSERIFTLDGEIFESNDEPLTIEVGPTVDLAMRPGDLWS